MPPKASVSSLSEADNKVLIAVLKHLPEIKPSWDEVAKEIGHTYARNAPPRFGAVVKKLGLRFEHNKITEINDGDGDNNVAAADSVAAVSQPKTKKPRVPKASKGITSIAAPTGKKRKLVEPDSNTEIGGDVNVKDKEFVVTKVEAGESDDPLEED